MGFFPFSLDTDLGFASATIAFPFGHAFESYNSQSGPYSQNLLLFNSSTGIPCVGISAGLCFVFIYLNATSDSLAISVIWFLTKMDVFFANIDIDIQSRRFIDAFLQDFFGFFVQLQTFCIIACDYIIYIYVAFDLFCYCCIYFI